MQDHNELPSTRTIVVFWAGLLVAAVATISVVPKEYAIPVVGLFGSISAVLAALIAYRAATAKVDFDREVYLSAQTERKTNHFLRAQTVAASIAEHMRMFEAHLHFGEWHEREVHIYPVRMIRFERPVELIKLWDTLGLFPPKIINEIRLITEDIDRFLALTAREQERGNFNEDRIVDGPGSPSEPSFRMKNRVARELADIGTTIFQRAITLEASLKAALPLEGFTDSERTEFRHGNGP